MTEILIYGRIGEDPFDEDGGVTTKAVKRALDAADGDSVTVRVNSYGGDAFEGIGIYNVLRDSGKTVTVKVDGVALSAASIVAMAGGDIRMASNALMMIHDPWTMAAGGADDLREAAAMLDKTAEAIADTYVAASGKAADEVRAMMAAETWLSATEAVEAGFASTIVGESKAQAMLTDKRVAAFKRPPAQIQQWMRPAATQVPGVQCAAQAPEAHNSMPATGKEQPTMSDALVKALSADTEEQALTIVNEINSFTSQLLEATGAKSLDAALAAVKANAALPGVVKALSGKVEALEEQNAARDREALIAELCEAKKLPPSLHDWARSQTLESLQTFGQSAPVLGGAADPKPVAGPPDDAPVVLNDEQRKLAEQMGMSAEDYAAEVKAERKRGTAMRVTFKHQPKE